MKQISRIRPDVHIILQMLAPIMIFSIFGINLSSCALLQTRQDRESLKQKADILEGELILIKKLVDEGKAEKAWMTMRLLLQDHSDHPEALNLSGLIHLALDNHPKSIQYFKKSYKLKPSIASGLNLSSAYIASGQYRTARKTLIRLLRSSQKYLYRERLWHNLALTWEKDKNLLKAERYYRKALKVNPTYFLSLIRLASVSKQRGQTGKAISLYQKAHRNCKGCFEPVNELANHYLQTAQYSSAVKILSNYLKTQQKILPRERDQAKHLLNLAKRVNRRQNRAK